MATFLWIHGAWHGGWCWERVAKELGALGHEAHAPDLPGHHSDPAEPSVVTTEDHATRVVGRLGALREPAVLVGRPMGAAPLGAPLHPGEGFARTRKHSIERTRDAAISIERQRDMVSTTPGVTVHTLETDPSPFRSQPAELAGPLDRVAAHA